MTLSKGQLGIVGETVHKSKKQRAEIVAAHDKEEVMPTYKLTQVQGHLIVDIDGHTALADSGSPVSLALTGRTGGIVIGDAAYACLPSPPIWAGGPDLLTYLRNRLDLPHMDYLIGMDILSQYRMRVDIPNGRLSLLRGGFNRSGTPITTRMGYAYPSVTAEINGVQRTALYDTGAPLAFVPQDLVEGLQPVGTEEEFLPGYGGFTTPVYEVPVTIDGDTRTIRAGILPAGPFTFIVGTELLQDRVAEFDFPAKRLRYLRAA